MKMLVSRSKIVLINPPPDYDREVYKRDISMGVGIPFGILILASALKNKGFSVRLIDGQICDCRHELISEIQEGNCLCVGFSVMSSQYQAALELSTITRKLDKEIKVVWGGFHPTILPEATLENHAVDYVFMGESDRAFLHFCDSLLNNQKPVDIGNIVFLANGRTIRNDPLPLSDFKELPRMDWSLLENIELYVKKTNPLRQETRLFSILTGLGCNFRCSFCHNAIQKKRHRVKPAKEIIDEMNILHETYGITEFGLVDENFFSDRNRLDEFLNLLELNQNKFLWSSSLWAGFVNEKYLNKDTLHRIAESGGYYFGVGAESGSEIILKKLNKKISLENVLNLAKWTRHINMTIAYSFIAGIPGENCSTTLNTLRFIDEVKKINPESMIIGPQIFRPYPGSPLYQEALKSGLKEPEDWNRAGEFFKMLSHFRHIDVKALPWHDDPVKFKYMMLSFYILQINKKRNPLINFLLALLKLLSWLRLKTGFYSFFLEKPILDYVNKKIS